jgi:outer membrane protein assembly factor BamD
MCVALDDATIKPLVDGTNAGAPWLPDAREPPVPAFPRPPMAVSTRPAALRPALGPVLGATAALLVFGATSAARADWMDSLNPMNWWGDDKYETKAIVDPPANDLYKKGVVELEKRDYETSAKTFTKLEKAYPYSQYQRKGLLMATYTQFQDKKYDDAIGSAKRYLGLYPNSSDTPYITYLEGMSYYNQIPDVNHDLDRADKAIEVFNTVVTKYPDSEYAADARYKLAVAKDQLAGQEMTVGRYYLYRAEYTAAINRFRTVLAKYQTTRQAEEALERLTEAYLALGLPQEAQTAAAVLGHNFPNSSWYKQAYSLLQQGGLSPNEDKGSWISKTFHGMGVG